MLLTVADTAALTGPRHIADLLATVKPGDGACHAASLWHGDGGRSWTIETRSTGSELLLFPFHMRCAVDDLSSVVPALCLDLGGHGGRSTAVIGIVRHKGRPNPEVPALPANIDLSPRGPCRDPKGAENKRSNSGPDSSNRNWEPERESRHNKSGHPKCSYGDDNSAHKST